jgi:uncharacterized membrane-anchored protein YitT (DUF2179 family)
MFVNANPSGPSIDNSAAVPHTLLEDAYALIVGTVLMTLGLMILAKAGLVTGGVAGIALVLSYLTGVPFGVFFVALTIPPLFFTRRTMGHAFVIKTLVVTLSLFATTLLAPTVLQIASVNRAVAAIAGGSVIGMGALALARHGAGSGGSGVIILWLYRTRGWNAGRTQMLLDGMVLLLSLVEITPLRCLWSLLGLAATASILYVWHRPGRYTGY